MSTNLPTVDEVKQQIESLARIAFSSPDHPQAIGWKRESVTGDVVSEMLSLAVSVSTALAHVGSRGFDVVALAVEAWGESKDDDIVAVTIDHPEGIHVGRATVHADGERVRAFEWTTTITPPDEARTMHRFPVFTMTGALLKR